MHSILVFFFNVAILGATVNVASGLLKPDSASHAPKPVPVALCAVQ